MFMPYQIQKLNQISGQLQNGKQVFLELVAREGKEKMRKYVEQHWYGVYTPKDYARTDEVLNSISARFEGDVVVIYYDESKISSVPAINEWGQHIGFNGEGFEIAYIEKGVSGGVDSNPRRGMEGANAILRLRGWLANYITKAVQQAFGASVRVG